jgi:hypothetical protein
MNWILNMSFLAINNQETTTTYAENPPGPGGANWPGGGGLDDRMEKESTQVEILDQRQKLFTSGKTYPGGGGPPMFINCIPLVT